MWLRMMVCILLVCLVWPAFVGAESKTAAKLALWHKLLKEGNALADRREHKPQLEGAKKLWQAFQLRPKAFKSLEAGARACIIRASFATSKQTITMWGKTGWHLGTKMIKMRPKRAEGYIWSSMMIGHYARAGSIWRAIKGGLGGKIKNMALESLKRDRRIYKGAAQRVLGRYYFKVPWPWRSLKKSLTYLEEANKLAPRNIQGIRYLADTLWALGKKVRARRLYQKCARAWIPGLPPQSASQRCREWLKKNK